MEEKARNLLMNFRVEINLRVLFGENVCENERIGSRRGGMSVVTYSMASRHHPTVFHTMCVVFTYLSVVTYSLTSRHHSTVFHTMCVVFTLIVPCIQHIVPIRHSLSYVLSNPYISSILYNVKVTPMSSYTNVTVTTMSRLYQCQGHTNVKVTSRSWSHQCQAHSNVKMILMERLC